VSVDATMSDADRIIDVLTKLIAKQKSCEEIGTEATLKEAEALAGKVAELLTKYKLSMTDVEVAKHEREQPIDREDFSHDAAGIDPTEYRVDWTEMLAGAIARGFFCRTLIWPKSNRVTFVGRKSDREIAIWMFCVVARKLEREPDRQVLIRRQVYGPRSIPDAAVWKNGFRRGAVEAIRVRLEAARADTMAGQNDRALVLVKRADEAVDDWMQQNLRLVGMPAVGSRHIDAQGAAAGDAWGKKVSLTPNAVGANGKAALQLGSGQ
jgi:hypothetical protein